MQFAILKSFLGPALIGAAGGVAYKAINIYTKDYYPVKNLSPTPEAFYVDQIAFDIFARLQKHRASSPKHFISALLKTDQLLKLHDALTKVHPDRKDLNRARYYFLSAFNSGKILCKQILKDGKATTEECTDLLKLLYTLLNHHYEEIRGICKKELTALPDNSLSTSNVAETPHDTSSHKKDEKEAKEHKEKTESEEKKRAPPAKTRRKKNQTKQTK